MNQIDATARIGPDVVIGDGNIIGPYAVIAGRVAIGSGNYIGAHAVIGGHAQHSTGKPELKGDPSGSIDIGDRNVIREFATINHPVEERTMVENDCYIMAYANVSHDSIVRTGAILSSGCLLGGFSDIGERANLGYGVLVHQFSTIGAFAMVGMGTAVIRDIPPFLKVVGNPVRLIGINDVGMSRSGFDEAAVAHVRAQIAMSRLPDQGDAGRRVRDFVARANRNGRSTLTL